MMGKGSFYPLKKKATVHTHETEEGEKQHNLLIEQIVEITSL